jgi:hypothetical protein
MEKWKQKTLPLSHRPGYDDEVIRFKKAFA